jgi:hypothetical protein
MPTPFPTWRFIFPPRTDMLLPPGMNSARSLWESFPDAIAQYKLNGSRNLTVIHPDERIELWGRGKAGQPGTIQRQIPLSPLMRKQIESLGLSKGRLHVLDGEFVHAKTSTVKDVLYQFDILVHDSEHLIGMTGEERYALLHRIMSKAGVGFFPIGEIPRPGQYLAQCHKAPEWESMWQRAQSIDYCEGLVIKRMGPASVLVYGGQEYNNSGWMTRMRKPKKNYAY